MRAQAFEALCRRMVIAFHEQDWPTMANLSTKYYILSNRHDDGAQSVIRELLNGK